MKGSEDTRLSTTALCALGVLLAAWTLGYVYAKPAAAQRIPATLATPTGREPRLIWTPQRQATWARMRADYDANPAAPPTSGGRYYRAIKDNAECRCRYADTGLWATLMYQMTGDRAYADLAWRAIESWFFRRSGTQLGGNFAREYSAELVLQYDWLYPALPSAQRATYIAKLNELFATTLTNPSSPNAPVRTADSDQTVGTYFGLAFLFLATGDHNSQALDFFHRPFVGGLAATGRDRSTLRNAIRDYVAMAEGGEWIEGSEYNLGTVRLLLMGTEGVRTASGEDHFPEVTAWLPEAARRSIHVLTPDLRHAYEWGDTEHPHDFRGQLFDWLTTHGMLAGLTDRASAAHLQDRIVRLATAHGETGNRFSEPWARTFLTFDPYATTASPDELPFGWFAPGQGLLISRTGWDDRASLFGAHVPRQQLYVDHQVSYFGDWQLYRRGAWAITHPLGYGGPPILGEGTNTVLHAGFGTMAEFKDVVAVEHDTRGRFAYIAGTTGGQKYAASYYQPPPTYLHEWTRSLLYVPSMDRRFDTVIIFDRSHAEDPRDLPAFQRYSAADRQTIERVKMLRQWILHMPDTPEVASDRLNWTVSSGDRVQVTMLLPRSRDTVVVDERELWPNATVPAAQRKWQVRIAPAEDTPWVTFLNVIDVHDPASRPTSRLVATAADDMQGTVVRREGAADVLALFNAEPGRSLRSESSARGSYDPATPAVLRRVRLRQRGFTIEWPASTTVTEVFVADLDPTRRWQYRVDGGPPVTIVVSEGGLGRFNVPGARSHSLTVF